MEFSDQKLLGKSVSISDDAIERSKNIITQSQSQFGGFSTGLGKSVEISENALRNAKNLPNPPKPSFGGFPSGLGTISDESKSQKPKFSGFSTGLGNSVKISDEAVNRSKNLWTESPETSKSFANVSETQRESEAFFAQVRKTTETTPARVANK